MSVAVLVFVVCAVACAVANIAILFSTLGRPARPDAGVPGVAGGVPRPHRAAEIAWALLPVLILALVLTATWARVRERDTRPVEVMKVAR